MKTIAVAAALMGFAGVAAAAEAPAWGYKGVLPYDCAVEMEEGYVYELVDTMPVYPIYPNGKAPTTKADDVIATDVRGPARLADDPYAAEQNA